MHFPEAYIDSKNGQEEITVIREKGMQWGGSLMSLIKSHSAWSQLEHFHGSDHPQHKYLR